MLCDIHCVQGKKMSQLFCVIELHYFIHCRIKSSYVRKKWRFRTSGTYTYFQKYFSSYYQTLSKFDHATWSYNAAKLAHFFAGMQHTNDIAYTCWKCHKTPINQSSWCDDTLNVTFAAGQAKPSNSKGDADSESESLPPAGAVVKRIARSVCSRSAVTRSKAGRKK